MRPEVREDVRALIEYCSDEVEAGNYLEALAPNDEFPHDQLEPEDKEGFYAFLEPYLEAAEGDHYDAMCDALSDDQETFVRLAGGGHQYPTAVRLLLYLEELENKKGDNP